MAAWLGWGAPSSGGRWWPRTDADAGASAATCDEGSACNRRLWMTELRDTLGERPLTQVKMVGTHNSATHTIRAGSCGGTHPGAAGAIEWLASKWYTRRMTLAVTAPWAQCQARGIRRQLEDGVRYLDLRVGVRVHHSEPPSRPAPPLAYSEPASATESPQRSSTLQVAVNALSPLTATEVPTDVVDDDEAVAAATGAEGHAEPLPPGSKAPVPAMEHEEELWTCHTVWGCTLVSVVADIAAFFEALPAGHVETVIIDIQKSFGFTSPRHEEMLARALQPIARLTIERNVLTQPLSEVWAASGERRIFIVHHDEAVVQRSPVVASPRHVSVASEWMKTRHVPTLCSRLRDMLRGRRANGMEPPASHRQAQLWVTQGVLTPSERDVAAAALAGVPYLVYRSIADMAAAANPAVLGVWEDFVPERATEATPAVVVDRRNVLLLDYYERGAAPRSGLGAVDLCIALNGVRRG